MPHSAWNFRKPYNKLEQALFDNNNNSTEFRMIIGGMFVLKLILARG